MWWTLGLAIAQPVADGWVSWPPTGDLAGARPVEGRRIGENGQLLQRVLIPPGAAQALKARGVRVHDLHASHALGPPADGYHTPATGTALLRALADTSPRARIVPLGTSVLDRPIDALVLGVDPEEGAPTLRVFGAHHGDEAPSWEVALALASQLVEQDGTDPRVTGILERSTVWIVPFVNPDGAAQGSRLNANAVDLNRNYDFEWSVRETFGGPGPFSEPETRAVRAFGHLVQPVASLSLHSGATNFGWVWNHTLEPASDAAAFEQIALNYASRCSTPDFWVTNGADWYITYGDTNDWSYGWYGVYEFTLELAAERTPYPEAIDGFVGEHMDAILDFLDQPPRLSGRIVDAETGWPVMARLTVPGSASFYADPSTGAFHRGDFADEIEVAAPGYQTARIVVGASPVVVELQPDQLRSGRAEPWAIAERASVRVPEGARGNVITWLRPGAEPVETDVVDGTVEIVPARMAPGAWALVDAQGTTWPHALWIDGPERSELVARSVEGDRLTLMGTGLARAAGAWAFVGTARVALPILEADESSVVLDLSQVPPTDRLDVGLWVDGSLLGLSGGAPRAAVEPGCGCRSVHPGSVAGGLLALGLLLARRSRRRGGRGRYRRPRERS